MKKENNKIQSFFERMQPEARLWFIINRLYTLTKSPDKKNQILPEGKSSYGSRSWVSNLHQTKIANEVVPNSDENCLDIKVD